MGIGWYRCHGWAVWDESSMCMQNPRMMGCQMGIGLRLVMELEIACIDS